ncbi:MAG: FG-GAP-like repeat-containing protein [Melioribacteraceae bacterium]|nr:FG-GAP-like repeat-containing protein [Melioribacteraceae bacterium]
MKKLLFIYIFVNIINAQTYQREIDPFPFLSEGKPINNTFSGGTNNAEHQFDDIDGDGDYDLFILNSDGTYDWYENTGSQHIAKFILSPEFIPGLELKNWFQFLDIDNDDDLDLFTGGVNNSVRFFENIGDKFTPEFSLADGLLSDNEANPVYSESISNPLFADFDGDNDYDLLSGDQSGTVNYHENIGTPDSIILAKVEHNWQNILIISGGKNDKHGASTLEAGDIDGDALLELLWGDFFSRSLFLIENDGTPTNPNLLMPPVYDFYPPNEDSLFTRGYNMPRLVDIDGDNDLDLFVSVLFDPTVEESLIFFRNIGGPESPDFRKETDDYLRTLDIGTKSFPSFADIDADGDLDLFIGSEENPEGNIYFFENNGTVENPSFNLVSKSYFDIKNDLSVAPTFADIDNDGDLDLFVGIWFPGNVLFYKNIGTKFNADFVLEGPLADSQNNQIREGNYTRPQFIDLDNDNDLDLIIGSYSGKLKLYTNAGNSTQYSFEEDLSLFADIDVGEQSNPFFIDKDSDGDYDLFIGCLNGNIFLYENIGTPFDPSFELVTDNYFNINAGQHSAPVLADIDGDSDLDLFIGNIKGGIYFYRSDEVSSIYYENDNHLIGSINLNAYPNPFNSFINIFLNVSKEDYYSVSIFDILGQEIAILHRGILKQGTHNFNWDGINSSGKIVSSGIYYLNAASFSNSKTTLISFIK